MRRVAVAVFGFAAAALATVGVGATIATPPSATQVASAPPEWVPAAKAGSSAARIAIVLNSESDNLSIIQGSTFSVTDTVPVGREPHHWVVDPAGRLMIANTRGNDVVYVDRTTGKVDSQRPSITNPYLAGYSPDHRWFVVNSLRLGHLDIYDGRDLTLVKRLKVGGMPSHLTFDLESRKVFVTLQQHDQLIQVDLEKQEIDWRLQVGDTPAGVLLTPDGNHLMVGVMGEADVAVVDWRNAKVVQRVPTGRGSHNLLQVPDKPFALVSNRSVNTISVIDQRTFTVVDTLSVPGGPDCMAFSPDGKQLWVTARWRAQVHVVDPAERRVVQTIPVGRSPHGIYVE